MTKRVAVLAEVVVALAGFVAPVSRAQDANEFWPEVQFHYWFNDHRSRAIAMASISRNFEATSEAWQVAMDQRKFDDAIKAGIDSYLHYRAESSQKLSLGSLNFIYPATGRLIFGDEFKLRLCCCSFCGRGGADVRLGAGPEAFICADCVSILYQELVTKKSGQKGT